MSKTPRPGHFLTRDEATAIIHSEQDHAYRRYGNDMHSFAEWVLFMQGYLAEAQTLLTHNATDDVAGRVGAIIRKVGCCALTAIEQNGGAGLRS